MFRLISFISLLVLLSQCTPDQSFQGYKPLIITAFENGDYLTATDLIENSLLLPGLKKDQKRWLIARQAMMDRTQLDFSKSRDQVKAQLFRYFPSLSDSLMNQWERTGHLEMKMIDGNKRYFRNAVSNLFRLDTAAANVRRTIAGTTADPLDSIKLENTSAIIRAGKTGQTAETRVITIEYTLTVDADAVPAGEEIRCWMPFPGQSNPRQNKIILLGSDPAAVIVSKTGCIHSSLYVTKKASAGVPTLFTYKASFEISGQWFNPGVFDSFTAEKVPGKFRSLTREEPPHIVFSPLVRHLADSLSTGESNPFKIIRSFYYWIDQNIPWASALEYSTFECIPDYVLQQGHGDCGMKTFLLMSMARYMGIPARWQSGWMLHPGEENLHDWCEIWFAQTGWVPVDMSFGIQKSTDPLEKEFYLSGIDSYRMIVNEGFSGEFCPTKEFIRSEPFDFQRGEVEWKKGNIYFNQWDYNLNVLSIEKTNQ